MEQQEPSEPKDLSNSVYDLAYDLSGYQHPDLSLVSDEFKQSLVSSMPKRGGCSFPVLLGDHSNLQIEDLFNRPNLLIAGTTGSGKTQFLYNQIAFWFGKLENHFLAAVDKGSGIVTPENFRETATGVLHEDGTFRRIRCLESQKKI